MSYSLNSLKEFYYRGNFRGLLQGFLREILGVQTVAHMHHHGGWVPDSAIYVWQSNHSLTDLGFWV